MNSGDLTVVENQLSLYEVKYLSTELSEKENTKLDYLFDWLLVPEWKFQKTLEILFYSNAL